MPDCAHEPSFEPCAAWRTILAEASVLLAFPLGQTGFRLAYYGEWLPNTYYLKVAGIPLKYRIPTGLWHVKGFLVSAIAAFAVAVAGLVPVDSTRSQTSSPPSSHAVPCRRGAVSDCRCHFTGCGDASAMSSRTVKVTGRWNLNARRNRVTPAA